MTKYNNRTIIALTVNLLIVALEIAGLILSVQKYGLGVFQFYTENSNYFALIVSTIFCMGCIVSLIKSTPIPNWIHTLRYISTACLTLTFVVISFVLSPLYPVKFVDWLFKGSGLYQHLLCPIISFVSFVFIENTLRLSKKTIWIALAPTICYGVVCIVLNILKLMTGPYPFFYVYELPLYISIPSLIGMILLSFSISLILYKVNNNKHAKMFAIKE